MDGESNVIFSRGTDINHYSFNGGVNAYNGGGNGSGGGYSGSDSTEDTMGRPAPWGVFSPSLYGGTSVGTNGGNNGGSSIHFGGNGNGGDHQRDDHQGHCEMMRE